MKPLYPSDLETQYSDLFGDFLETVNQEFLKLLLKELGPEKKEITSRLNASPLSELRKKIQNLTEKLLERSGFKNIFKAMESIFKRVDNKIIASITSEFRKEKIPIPKLSRKVPESFKQSVKTNVNLIQEITRTQIKKLSGIVENQVLGKSTFEQTVNKIQKTFQSGKAYATFVAQDQLAKAHADISQERQTEAGFPGYIWLTMNDFKTRESHRAMHGKYVDWKKPPLIDDRNLHAGQDYRCRCIARPAFRPMSAPKRKYRGFDAAA